MSIDYVEATSEILGVLKTAWSNNALSILTAIYGACKGYIPVLLCTGDIYTEDLNIGKIRARAMYQGVANPQTSFRNGDQTRIFEATGMLGVQIYCPKNVGRAYDGGRLLAKLVQSSFRNPPAGGSVSYSNQRIIEQGAVNSDNQINIYIDCRYQTTE